MTLRILLVEDDRSMRDALTRMFRAAGATVIAAAAAGEVPPARFDLAVLDIDLPGIDGVTLGQSLLTDGIVPRILFHTAATDPALLRRAAATGTVIAKGATTELTRAVWKSGTPA